MSLLVVGSVALDSVKTPFGQADESVGGSAMYFSASASYYAKVRLVAVIGRDFPKEPVSFLKQRGVNLDGLHQSEGETFRWKGEYGYDLNEAKTIETQLNVFSDFEPVLDDASKQSEVVFLANIDPSLQLQVLDQVERPKFVACDTMNLWISTKLEELKRVLARVDMAVINEGEARMLSGESNMVAAAAAIREMGPRFVVIKRGEYGALLFTPEDVFFAPAYPLEAVFDPTGAGDTFAGGLLGYLANRMSFDDHTMRRATVIGCVMASFCVERFSYDNLKDLDWIKIKRRFEMFQHLTSFDALGEL